MGAKPIPPARMVETGGMIRNGYRPHRMGAVGIGTGGSALTYSFDPSSGLSNDPALPTYLQNLTPGQLQTALNGQDPSGDLISLLQQEQTGTGAGYLPCGTAANPTCGPANGGTLGLNLNIPGSMWVWVGVTAALGFLLFAGGRR
jgi:hypothetical protein